MRFDMYQPLQSALDARTREFEQLRLQSSQSAEENDRLKAKMQQLSEQNKSEQHQLDQAMQDLVFEQNGTQTTARLFDLTSVFML